MLSSNREYTIQTQLRFRICKGKIYFLRRGVKKIIHSTMPDLSRESVQYVCTRFRSPHIARKYGHKINSDYQENRDNIT